MDNGSSKQIADINTIKQNTGKTLNKLDSVIGKQDIDISRDECKFPMLVDEETIPTGNYETNHVEPDGTLYSVYSHYIYKSIDGGNTWEWFIDMTAVAVSTLSQIRRLDTGEFIICTVGGEVYKSDENGENPRLVYTDTGRGYVYRQFGLQVYGKIIVVGAYGAPDKDNITMAVSVDYGETFDEIWKGEEDVRYNHIHDAKFDPYENLFWVVTGDGFVQNIKNRIYWSDDFGKNWNVYYGPRITQIIPLPNSVLFVSDEVGRNSVYRYQRPLEGTTTINDISPYIKESWYAKDNLPEPSAFRWGTNAAIKYGKGAKAYFGYKLHSTEDLCTATVYGTTDGIRFTPIWTAGKPKPGGGISGTFGPDASGMLYVALQENEGEESTNKLLKLQVE